MGIILLHIFNDLFQRLFFVPYLLIHLSAEISCSVKSGILGSYNITVLKIYFVRNLRF